jgi:hypothetical protein
VGHFSFADSSVLVRYEVRVVEALPDAPAP